MKSILILVVLSLIVVSQSIRVYNVTARRYGSKPIIANSTTGWRYNYNAAAYNYEGNVELVVRVQNVQNKSNPYSVGPSFLSSSSVTFNSSGYPNATQPVFLAYVPDNSTKNSSQACGTEDPRITYHEGLYYMFFTSYNCTNAMLSLAVAGNPADPESWIDYGYVFPQKNWSKSAAVLFADKKNNLTQHYLFWGDSTYPKGGIGIATSNDTIHWQDTGKYILQTRSSFFDSALVESGPSPVRLSTGDFLYLYNSARHGYPSVKSGWDLQYNLGFAILNGSNPLTVMQRSALPLMTPSFDWEIGNNTNYLTPNVVFLEGLIPDPNGCPTGIEEEVGAPPGASADCFFGVYGGADTDLGAVRIIVTWTGTSQDGEDNSTNEEFISI